MLSQRSAVKKKLSKVANEAEGDSAQQELLWSQSKTLKKAKEDWQSHYDEVGADNKASAAKLVSYLDELGECTNWLSSYLLHCLHMLVLHVAGELDDSDKTVDGIKQFVNHEVSVCRLYNDMIVLAIDHKQGLLA